MGKVFINIENMAKIGQRYYFWARNCNGLFSIADNETECTLEFQCDNGRDSDCLLYGRCVNVSERLLILPEYADNFIVYDPKSKKREIIEKSGIDIWTNAYKIFNGWVYLFGGNNIARINIDDGIIENVSKNEEMSASTIYVIDRNVYVSSKNKDEIFCFDLSTCEFSRIELPHRGAQYNTVSGIGKHIFLSGDKSEIAVVNLNNMKTEYYDISHICSARDEAIDDILFHASYVCGNKVFFFPAKMDSVVSLENGTWKTERKLVLQANERLASFVRINENSGYILCGFLDDPSYKISRQFYLDEMGNIQKSEKFILPNSIPLKACNINETYIYNLERFMTNIITT